MRFRNLPNDPGEGSSGPGGQSYAPQRGMAADRQRNGHEVNFDPVTRVGGALAFRAVVDQGRGQVVNSDSLATLFRGYEILLLGRDVRDAIFVSSRACGVCGGSHAPTSAMALEMAFGIAAPPLGIVARNLTLALECLADHPLHLFLRAGPDYSEPVVRRTSPELWSRAESSTAAGKAVHGFDTIAEIMTALTRLSGQLHAEALHMSRVAREAYVLIGGKYPHPQTIVPGGISSTIDTSDTNEIFLRVVKFFDYSRKVVAIWDDLINFFYDADPRYREVGARPANMIDPGQWDDPYAYDGTIENADQWGRARWASPGVIRDGRLVTTKLTDINTGIEEFVDHSFYEDWTSAGDGDGRGFFESDPLANRLSPHHPWNKQTIPQPEATRSREKYSWSTAPRWEGQAMETGPYSRMWNTALARDYTHRESIDATGESLRFEMPKSGLPAAELEWRVPFDSWGALERNRARAYAMVFSTMIANENALIALDLIRKGEDEVASEFNIPKDSRVGVGFGSTARGAVTHHVVIGDGVVENYQIVSPSTWNFSPRDRSGKPGPAEEAVASTPLLGVYERPEDYIDVLRTIRSFDPCMACTTH